MDSTQTCTCLLHIFAPYSWKRAGLDLFQHSLKMNPHFQLCIHLARAWHITTTGHCLITAFGTQSPGSTPYPANAAQRPLCSRSVAVSFLFFYSPNIYHATDIIYNASQKSVSIYCCMLVCSMNVDTVFSPTDSTNQCTFIKIVYSTIKSTPKFYWLWWDEYI